MSHQNTNKLNSHHSQCLSHLLYRLANNPTTPYLVYGYFCSLNFHTLTIDKRSENHAQWRLTSQTMI